MAIEITKEVVKRLEVIITGKEDVKTLVQVCEFAWRYMVGHDITGEFGRLSRYRAQAFIDKIAGADLV